MKILLAEDEENLLEVIALNLKLEGYQVYKASDGKYALKLFKEHFFDLLILDIMLPEMDGLQVCEAVRLENKQVPILFLTAKNTPEDRVKGLKKGADDYLVKPFNLEELMLRVGILTKRSQKLESGSGGIEDYILNGNQILFNQYTIKTSKAEVISLSKKEMMLLKLLIERKNEVVSREEILNIVWEYTAFPSNRTIDNFILNFRKIFESNPKEPIYFHTVRGVGYRFSPQD
jgi:two-component system, OmpR family, alkaline phosphatase synthesis response regulator PhoP